MDMKHPKGKQSHVHRLHLPHDYLVSPYQCVAGATTAHCDAKSVCVLLESLLSMEYILNPSCWGNWTLMACSFLLGMVCVFLLLGLSCWAKCARGLIGWIGSRYRAWRRRRNVRRFTKPLPTHKPGPHNFRTRHQPQPATFNFTKYSFRPTVVNTALVVLALAVCAKASTGETACSDARTLTATERSCFTRSQPSGNHTS